LPPEVREWYRACGLIGESDAMQSAIAAAESGARCRVPVLLQGETGTGKELFARAIHYRSELADGPFVTVNCPAIPKELLESELFGHVKGAFTGATETRRGLFEIADGGTIFLDEIAETDTAVQAKLLRALENGEIQPVGTGHTRKVRVRVIAASNRDLRWACEQGVFREDLYYRLNGLRIVLPPLRERQGDVRILFRYFLDLFQREARKQLGPVDPEALGLMERYSWPGNVRELRNEVQRIVALLEPGERVSPDALSPELRRGQLPAENEGTLKDILQRVEAAVIRGVWASLESGCGSRCDNWGFHREGRSFTKGDVLQLGPPAPTGCEGPEIRKRECRASGSTRRLGWKYVSRYRTTPRCGPSGGRGDRSRSRTGAGG
jgi:Nif-specific regulatory protein